ncbi:MULTISPECIES: class I SAM-dependent methyltransferase [Dyella]|uniref:Class I SAM-dependent methyltransferase n=2 Tax=Dyella TaxID=231454 RepID=A0A4R0YVF8_9GAMM|nr:MULTISPECIES: class I SAM-dependent methyltransferase [Dyella]TBR39958.1 class I SAM-dependent methyltransferase [Dyella terrae]TCI12461.1 class I SAM-dependent methyltransferase [Dyella soli]
MDRLTRQRIANFYDGHFQRGYVRGKLASDPAYAATADAMTGSALPLLDIGCGIGLLGMYLHAKGALRGYVGMDHDERKIGAGRTAAIRAGLSELLDLRIGDAGTLPDLRGHVALIDVAHYLGRDDQQALLSAAATRVAPGGSLIIRTVLREDNWRFQVTCAEEWWLRASGLIRGGVKHYPDHAELCGPLRALGLQVNTQPMYGATPFNSYLIVAKRPG